MKCKRCKAAAEVHVRQHSSAFCRACFVVYFQRQVERAIHKQHMFSADEEVMVAVSGGKDSLALWDVLQVLGYRTVGLHLALGIGGYSTASTTRTEAFATERGLPLVVVHLEEEGCAIPQLAGFTNRPACAACGIAKRYYFDKLAFERGVSVLATGHNLDDEAARLLGNVLRWQVDHLAKQHPVLLPTHKRFVRKVKPLFRLSEYETAAYAFVRKIDYEVDECPNSSGATQLVYKDALNRIEAVMPGTKQNFVQDFLRLGYPVFARSVDSPPNSCSQCGMPAFAEVCSFCSLRREVDSKRARRATARRT